MVMVPEFLDCLLEIPQHVLVKLFIIIQIDNPCYIHTEFCVFLIWRFIELLESYTALLP